MQQPNGNPSEMGHVYTLLGESRRRYLLYQLMGEAYGNIDDLALQIAAWERGTPTDAVSEEAQEKVCISLVHAHLPRLADHNVVEYDLRSGDVVLADGVSALEPLLEQFKRTEEVPEIQHSLSL